MNLFKLELRNMRRGYIGWAVSLTAALCFLMTFFTLIQGEAMQALASAKLEGMPPAVLAMFGMEGMPDFTVMTNYYGMIVQYVILAFTIFSAQTAVNMLLREESDGSIEYLYAQPVSRAEIFTRKLAANVLGVALIDVLLFAVSLTGYIIFSDTGAGRALGETAALWSAVLFAQLIFMSVGTLISACMRSVKAGVSAALGLVLFSFLTALMSALSENLDWLIYCSPLDWLKFPRLLEDGLEPAMIIIGVTLIAVCNALALWRYRRKDFLS